MDYDTAQDLANDVAIKVWERARETPGFLAGPRELERYVAITCRNAWRKQAREARRRAEREAVFAEELGDGGSRADAGDTEATHAQRIAALDEALALVPRRRRVAFLLVYRDALSYGNVAARFAVSPRAVESRVRRTKIELRDRLSALAAHEPDPAA